MRPPRLLDPAVWSDALVASDPTFDRLRIGLRATLSAAGSTAVLAALAAASTSP